MSSDLGHHEEPPQPTSQTSPQQQQHQHSTSFNGSSPHFDKAVEDEELDLDEELDEEERQQLHDVKEYDPQIRQHLEELNRFATKINQLEKCVEEENSKFQKVLNESSVQLNKLAKRIGEKVVSEARPYYEAISKLKTLQIKCQKAAIKFEKYNELHAEAKQAIADTELMFLKEEEEKRDRNEEDVQDNGNFDHSWQEKLNQANINFIEARLKRQQYEDEHMAVMMEFRLLETKVTTLLKKHKNSIKKSKVYFDESTVYDCKRKAIKENIEQLGEELVESKRQYSRALKGLESISEEIHEKRSQILAKSLVREPGVGAELAATYDELDSGNISPSLSPSSASTKMQQPEEESLDDGCSILNTSDLEEKLKQL